MIGTVVSPQSDGTSPRSRSIATVTRGQVVMTAAKSGSRCSREVILRFYKPDNALQPRATIRFDSGVLGGVGPDDPLTVRGISGIENALDAEENGELEILPGPGEFSFTATRALTSLAVSGPESGYSYRTRPCFPLDQNWKARSVQEVEDPGTTISRIGYPTQDWLPAVVPGTVLGTLISNGIYEDPYFGTNNERIPDISESTVGFYTYWFRNSFHLPDFGSDSRLWLDLRGVNYTAGLFLNGEPVDVGYSTPPINTVTGEPLATNEIQGMFLRQSIDITDLVVTGGENTLAVQVQPPDPPGIPGGNGGGSPNIGNNVTMRYTVGWDWVIPTRDRNTGIWDQIAICATGPVRLQHPHVITRVRVVPVVSDRPRPDCALIPLVAFHTPPADSAQA